MTNSVDLQMENITKTFGSTVALDGFRLDVAPGEFVSLLGPSGCGKTTALRIMGGFEQPDSGAILVGGIDVTSNPPHLRNMGMVFQSYSLFPHLRVIDNVRFGLRMRKIDRFESETRAREMLDLVQVGDLANRFPHQLSGGQQQRVALARALAIRPDVLLLDEPLSALDAKVRAEVRQEIKLLTTRLGMTTIFVTHDQEEALGLSDRICVMNDGKLEQVGSPFEIYDSPQTAFVAEFIGELNQVRLNGHELRVRPEHVRLLRDETGEAVITSVAFRGATVRYELRLPDGQVLVATRAHTPDDVLAVGDQVSATFRWT